RPEMRASHVKQNVASLGDLGPATAERIRTDVPDVVRRASESVGVAWLPVELDVRLTCAVDRIAGRERMREWSRSSIVRATQGPLLRPIVAAIKRIGLTPHSALGHVQRGWGLVYRGCGELSYERAGEREGVLVQ